MDLNLIKRQLLFKKCDSKEELHAWIQLFLELDLPDCTVDPESTSNPMDLLWDLYNHAVKNDNPEYSRILAYSARGGFKTVTSAILETLFLVHLHRDIAHLASLESQSRICMGYVKDYLTKPYLRDLVTSDNARTIEICKYINVNNANDIITPIEFKRIDESSKLEYRATTNNATIIVATLKSVNGLHTPLLCVDERRLNRRTYYPRSWPYPYNG